MYVVYYVSRAPRSRLVMRQMNRQIAVVYSFFMYDIVETSFRTCRLEMLIATTSMRGSVPHHNPPATRTQPSWRRRCVVCVIGFPCRCALCHKSNHFLYSPANSRGGRAFGPDTRLSRHAPVNAPPTTSNRSSMAHAQTKRVSDSERRISSESRDIKSGRTR